MRPQVVVHQAVSLDAQTRNFSPDLVTFYGLAGRWPADATLAGADTILATPEAREEDDPSLPLRPLDRDSNKPLLVVTDSQGRLRCWQALARAGVWRGLICLCSESTPAEYVERLQTMGVQTIRCGMTRVDLEVALRELAAQYGVKTLRVDSGGRLATALFVEKLVDELSLLVHPTFSTGEKGQCFFCPEEAVAPEDRPRLHRVALERMGELIWMVFRVESPVGRTEKMAPPLPS